MYAALFAAGTVGFCLLNFKSRWLEQAMTLRSRGEHSRLTVLLLAYLAASLLHFAHNAEFLGDYPNLPSWLSRSDVYLAWVGQAVIGLAGFVLYLRGLRSPGLLLMGLFAAFGFDGLLHYSRATFGAHTLAMNFTIWFEVVAAAVLLVAVVFALVRRLEVPGSG